MNKFFLGLRRFGLVLTVLMLLCAGAGLNGSASAQGLQAAGDDALLSDQSPNPVVGVGQSFQIFISLSNSGVTTWQKGTYWLQNLQNPMGATPIQPLSGPIIPTGVSVWTIRLTAPAALGVYRTTWQVNHSGTGFGPLVNIDVKVAPGWVGGVTITSDSPLVSIGRPEIGASPTTQFMTYSGFPTGSPVMYVPMLFSNAWGLYNSALYVQNVDPDGATDININYYDTNGNLTCIHQDNIAPLASHGYWIASECVPNGWVGGAVITSNRSIVALGRPHVGPEVTTYNGFASGSLNMYVPMLFSNAWGGYNAALYIQNTDAFATANISIQYRDLNGNLTCGRNDSLAPRAVRGYWVPSECVPNGWVGGAVITSDHEIVAVGRPHIGTQITAYDGFSAGSTNVVAPMLFKAAGASGANNSALYVQNVDSSSVASVSLDFYDLLGNLTCSIPDTIPPYSSHGYWVPSIECLPDGWTGSVSITSDLNIVALGRPHFGAEIFTYNGATSSSLSAYLPMLFRVGFGGTYNSAYYLTNTDPSNAANATIDYYDSVGNLVCSQPVTIDPHASLDTELIDVDLPCP